MRLKALWNNLLPLQNDEKESYELGAYPCHGFVAASQGPIV